MKYSSLIFAFLLTLLDLFLMNRYEVSQFSQMLCCLLILSCGVTGFVVSVNSFFGKISVAGAVVLWGVFLNRFDLESTIILIAFLVHVCLLWFELEKIGVAAKWAEHQRIRHRLRHQWFGVLTFMAGLALAYLVMRDFYNYSFINGSFLLIILAVLSLVVFETNRIHHQTMIWQDISGALTGSLYYWRFIFLGGVVVFSLFWFFGEPISQYLLIVRAKLEKEEKPKDDSSNKGNGNNGSNVGFTPGEVELTPQVDLKLTDNPEFYVKLDPVQGRRLRNKILYYGAQELVHFSGKSWLPQKLPLMWFKDSDDGLTDGFVEFGQPHSYSVRQTFFLIKNDMTAIFSLPGLHKIELPEVFLSETGILGLRNGDVQGFKKYSVHSNYYNIDFIRKGSLKIGKTDEIYTDFPKTPLTLRISEFTNTIVSADDSDLEKVLKIRSYLQKNYSYSLKVLNPNKLDPIENFLFEEKRGHCLLFSSAFTLMLRSVGVPARLVNGFAGGDYDLKEDIHLVRTSNAHIWTEVFCDNYGWIVCDATPEAENIQNGMVKINDFDEKLFADVSPNAMKAENQTSHSKSWLFSGNSWLIYLILAIIIYLIFWKIYKKADFGSNRTTIKKEKFLRPLYIQNFEEFCRSCGIQVTKNKTVRELLVELLERGEKDEVVLQMINYYYGVTFSGKERNSEQELSWQEYLQKLTSAVAAKNKS